MKYRDCLYKNYSNNFGAAKPSRPELEFEVFDRTYSSIETFKSDAKIADLGCGRGEWLLWLKKRGFDNLSGFDISTGELEKAHSSEASLTLEEGDVTAKLKEKDGSYDLLHAKDIFEHFTKDEALAFMEASLQALKVGGELWILTYNAQAPLAASTGAGDFTHELAITPSSIGQLARATGYEVVSIRGLLPVRGGLKGTMRLVLYQIMTSHFLALKHLRHGFVSDAQGGDIEMATLMPDLFIKLRKG